MLLYHLTTIFTSLHSPFHHLLSFTQCLFQNHVSSTYSVTITTQLINFKCYHSHTNFLFSGCMLHFIKNSPYYSPTGILVWFITSQPITRHLDHSGTSPRPYGIDIICPLEHLTSVYSVSQQT